ncbi:MAG: hypothetical protein H6594_02730 [Flavobacteriales bacterium]|nr:hypothetical protein [Flavobacteriales bacterium]
MRKGWSRSWGKVLVMVLSTWAVLEIAPYPLSPLVSGEGFSRSAVRHDLLAHVGQVAYDTAAPVQEEYLSESMLHPYLGFVHVPSEGLNRFGLAGDDPVMHRAPDTVNICLMGGSVAMGVHTFSLQRLLDRLGRLGPYKGKHFRVCVLALGGFKQPQPLQALTWFRALGAEYDLILVLDGFNEIVLPYCDNLPFGVFPDLPRHWNMFARKKMDLRMQRLAAERVATQLRREADRAWFARWPWRWSNAALLIWRTLDHRREVELASIEARTREALAMTKHDPQTTGPAWQMPDTMTFLSDRADEWARCQRLIAEQARSMGAVDAHFLQPDQYVPGSKPFSEEERAIAIAPEPNCYREAVEKGYPLLSKEAAELAAEGMTMNDLTLLFQKEHRMVYGDACCHFVQLGWDLLADAMADAVAVRISQRDPASPARQP